MPRCFGNAGDCLHPDSRFEEPRHHGRGAHIDRRSRRRCVETAAWPTANGRASPAAEPILTAIVSQIVRQRHDDDLNTLVEVVASVEFQAAFGQHAGGAESVESSSCQSARRRSAADCEACRSCVRRPRNRWSAKRARCSSRKTPRRTIALRRWRIFRSISFENQRELLDQLLSPQESAAVREAVLATLGPIRFAGRGGV